MIRTIVIAGFGLVWLGAVGCRDGAPGTAPPAGGDAGVAPGPGVGLRLEARGLPTGDERRAVFVLERETAAGGFERVPDAGIVVVPGGADVTWVGQPGLFRLGAVWTSIHAEYGAPVRVDAGDVPRVDLAADAVTTAVGTPGTARGIVRHGGAPVGGARVEIDGGLPGVPPVVISTDVGGHFSVGPCSVPTLTIAVSHPLGERTVRGPSTEVLEVDL